ncbi:MAG: ABC transporter permease [Acidobacteriota bacterium]
MTPTRPKSLPGRHFVRNLIERRALIAQLVRRDFDQRYIGSAAGWLWGVAHPLISLLTYYFVFQICLKQTLPTDAPTTSYVMFLLSGYLPWMLFQDTVTRSASSLVEQSNLITKTVFPSEVVAVAIFLSSLIQHLIGLGVVMVAGLVLVHSVSPMLLLLPVYMLLVGLLAIGIGWIASSLHVYLRDTGQVLTIVMTLWFWATPIMIRKDQVPPYLQFIIQWNPLSRIVEAYRDEILRPTWPWPNLHELGIGAAYSIAVFIAGGLFFRVLKRGFADVL